MLTRYPRPNSPKTSWLPWPVNLLIEWLIAIYRQGARNAAGIASANAKLNRIMAELAIDVNPPSQPGNFSIKTTGQIKSKGRTMLTFAIVNVPAVDMSDTNNVDVSKRTLIVKCGTGEPITLDVPGVDAVDEITDPGFVGNAGDNGAATLTYSDASGNVSAPRVVPFQLTDTVAPS